jgi:hypothetical protein
MISIEEAIEQFNQLPPEMIIEFSSKRVIEKLQKLEEKYKISLSGVVILVTVNALSFAQLPGYLADEFELEKSTAEAASKELETQIFNPISKRLNFLNPSGQKQLISLEEEKAMLLKIFKEDLLWELNSHPLILEAINKRIFFILAHQPDFKKELENTLYENIERLGSAPLLVDGRQATNNIANWLKNFIKQEGASMFDQLTLSRFVSNNANTKTMDEEQKKLLIKILLIYRNIKFFPESMPSDDGEDWEILPAEEEIEAKQARVEKRLEGREKKLKELQEIAEQFAPGTLERRAVDEEIRKIS